MLWGPRLLTEGGERILKIGALKEIFAGENRVAMTPDSALQLQKLGHSCLIETGAGANAGFTDEAYKAAGVTILTSAAAVAAESDVVVKVSVRPPGSA